MGGTLNAAVTLIDHLYGVHLVTANAIVTANVEELPPSHAIRRLMTPFGFRTEAINYQAAFALVNQNGLIHRASPFTVAGLEQIFEFARSAQSGITWATIPERRADQNIGDIDGRPPHLSMTARRSTPRASSWSGATCSCTTRAVGLSTTRSRPRVPTHAGLINT